MRDIPTVITPEPGRIVVCDDCTNDYTDRDDEGGILFQSKAICPACAPYWLQGAATYGETHFVRGRCPPGKSFADWVRDDLR